MVPCLRRSVYVLIVTRTLGRILVVPDSLYRSRFRVDGPHTEYLHPDVVITPVSA